MSGATEYKKVFIVWQRIDCLLFNPKYEYQKSIVIITFYVLYYCTYCTLQRAKSTWRYFEQYAKVPLSLCDIFARILAASIFRPLNSMPPPSLLPSFPLKKEFSGLFLFFSFSVVIRLLLPDSFLMPPKSRSFHRLIMLPFLLVIQYSSLELYKIYLLD